MKCIGSNLRKFYGEDAQKSKYGFQAFSNQRGVLHQWAPFSAIELMMPPYGRLKQKLIDLTIRFF